MQEATSALDPVNERVVLAVGVTVTLLHPPLRLAGVSIAMESERQQHGRTLANG